MRSKNKLFIISAILIFVTTICQAKSITGPDGAVGNLTGTVTDKADGKPIIGASVNIPDLRTGSITDENGHFTRNNLPKGVYLVQVSYVGYSTLTQKVDFTKTTVLNFQ